MVDRWVVLVGFIELTIACMINIFVLRLQFSQFRYKSFLQPLKRMLLLSVVFFILAALPLMFVYANTLWFHLANVWIIYVAIIANATAKVLISLMLLLIYRFKGND